MKSGIHPNYEECVIRCACGETVTTKSTKGSEMRVEICSKCHPFFTGKQKFVDVGGRVDKFKKRLENFKKLLHSIKKGKSRSGFPSFYFSHFRFFGYTL